MNKQALILAAGSGRRLKSAAGGKPKCMLRIGGRRLINHQIDMLRHVGIGKIGVVVGYQADEVRQALEGQCDFIENADHQATNSLYSLWLARHWVKGPFVLLNSDLLAHPDIYHRVMAINGSGLAYDRTSGGDDEHMKVVVEDQLVHAISKEMPAAKASGENVGILQFSAEAATALFDQASKLLKRGQSTAWAPAAVNQLVPDVQLKAVETGDLPWTEIDFPEDLLTAQNQVWPLIDKGRQPLGLQAAG